MIPDKFIRHESHRLIRNIETSMGKIYLVRHGQSEDNAAGVLGGRRDSSLTGLGREQAQRVAEELAAVGIDLIYASPLKRSLETARIIADRLGVEDLEIDDRLMERDFGILSGKPYADTKKYAADIVRVGAVEYFLHAEGAEEFPDLLSRAQEVLEEVKEKHAGEDVLLVTHSDLGKMIRAAYYGWTWEEGLRDSVFSNTDVFELTEDRLVYKKQTVIGNQNA